MIALSTLKLRFIAQMTSPHQSFTFGFQLMNFANFLSCLALYLSKLTLQFTPLLQVLSLFLTEETGMFRPLFSFDEISNLVRNGRKGNTFISVIICQDTISG